MPVEPGPGFQKFVDDLTVGGEAVTRKVVNDTLEELQASIEARWPVISGRSLAAWRIEKTEGPSGPVEQLVNRSGYAPFINHGLTYRQLAVEPFRAATRELPDAVKRGVKDL